MAKDLQGKEIKAGRIADLQVVKNQDKERNASYKYNHIRVQFPDGEEVSLLFTDHQIQEAYQRAKKNPEDLPKVGWLRDILD
jgi:hypothetical protein